jgi:hypothetical protein
MSEEALVDAVEDQCVSVATIARLCELTSVRIYQLSSRGVLPPIENGLLPLAASLAAYIKYLRGFSEFESAGVSTFASERTRLYRLRADAAELDKQVRMGALAPIDKIEPSWKAHTNNFRTRLLAVPNKLASRLVGLKSAAQVQAILTDELHEALREFSEARLEIPERPAGWAGAADPAIAADDEAADEADDLPMGGRSQVSVARSKRGAGKVADRAR